MTRYVIGPDVAARIGRDRIVPDAAHQLVAPTLLRSQLLTLLYESVRRSELSRREAAGHLEHVRGLRIRLLGDRVSQRAAWDIADRFGWSDTYDAEYLAVTQLQADAFITFDDRLARAARGLVHLAPISALSVGPEPARS